MSRSYRKTKIFGNTTAESEKHFKRVSNRSFRRKSKILIRVDEFDSIPFNIREVINQYSGDKDGKHYWRNATKKDMVK